MLRSVSLRDYMLRHPATVRSDATIHEAARSSWSLCSSTARIASQCASSPRQSNRMHLYALIRLPYIYTQMILKSHTFTHKMAISAYDSIQFDRDGRVIALVLNDGGAVHLGRRAGERPARAAARRRSKQRTIVGCH